MLAAVSTTALVFAGSTKDSVPQLAAWLGVEPRSAGASAMLIEARGTCSEALATVASAMAWAAASTRSASVPVTSMKM